MRKILSILVSVVIGILLIIIGAMSLSTTEQIDEKISIATLIASPDVQITTKDTVDINDLPLTDNPEIYLFDDPDLIVYMYVTVQKGNASDNTNHTWEEVNSNTKWFGNQQVQGVSLDKVEAIVQFGDETGPIPGEVGYSDIIPNATIEIRGASTSQSSQKSYKIELRDRAGKWRGQSTINLNKHVFDISRVRNKLAFDLIKGIPDMVSLRTQFVQLYVKDETVSPSEDVFIDYGLFTQIEQPNKAFLRNHLLDANGQLYKATNFEFYRYPDFIRTIDDPLYNPESFNTKLEVKGNEDHTKLIQMLDDVNNWEIPIEETFEKYFDADNYFTWLAFNILVGNIDTQSQNYYLYSPQNSEKWYFIPWDYDGAFDRMNREWIWKTPDLDWNIGVANYWGTVLPNRLFRVRSIREKLTEKIEELYLYLSVEQIQSMLNTYRPVTEPLVSQVPDLYHLPGTMDTYDMDYATIPLEIENNYKLYLESLETPMPFFLGIPNYEGDGMFFDWDDSYDFDAQNIKYEFMVSRDWEFTDIIFKGTTTNKSYISIPYFLDIGTYFWKVTATNDDGKAQYAFDVYYDAEGNPHGGMKYLLINEDYEIIAQ